MRYRILTCAMFAAILSSCDRVALAQTAQFPSAIASDANLKVAVNGVNTLLTATITSATLTTSVSSCAGIVANVLVTIDQEIMPVSGCSGTVIAFNSRGFDGTTAAAHNAGASIGAYVDAWHHNALRVEVEAIENALGTNLTGITTVGTITTGVWHGNVIGPTYGGTGINNGSSTLTLGGNVAFSGAYNPTFIIPMTGAWTFPAAGTLIGSADTATVTNTMLAGSIAASKLVGSDIATVGTITAGTWQGTLLSPAYGGTGINNSSKTITLGGNLTLSGAFNPTFVIPSSGSWTFPAAGTLVGSGDTGTVTNAMLAGSIAASKLIGTDIATVGTVTVGTWHGTPIANTYLASPVTVENCGSSSSCAAPVAVANYKVAFGTIAFSSATTATITGIPAFTSSSSFVCMATDPSHAYPWTIANQSTTSITITAGTSNSDTWGWNCQGN